MGPLAVLLLDGSSRAALVSARSLGHAGLKVGVAECSDIRNVPAFASRWCDSRVLVASHSNPTEYVDSILNLLDTVPAGVVLPMHDGSVEAIRARRSEIEQKSAVALPSEEALTLATDKSLTVSVAKRLQIPVPFGVLIRELADLREATRRLNFPIVVKPAMSWTSGSPRVGRQSCQVALTCAELASAVALILDAGSNVLLQQWISGRREGIMLLNDKGRILARFAQEAHHMQPPLGGSSVLRRSITPPADTTRMAESLVQEINLDGYAEVEFRRDDEGRPFLMEVNPRLSASVELAVKAGVDFPKLIYSQAEGIPIKPVTTYRVGLRMRWLGGEIYYLRSVFRNQGRPDVPTRRKAVGSFIMNTIPPLSYDYFDIGDPLPVLTAAVEFIRLAGQRSQKKILP